MHNPVRCTLLLVLLTAFVTPALAEEPVVVIVNSANAQELSLAEIRDIYTGKVEAWSDGQRISVYSLPRSDKSHETFSRRVLSSPAKGVEATETGTRAHRPWQTKSEELLVTIVSKKFTAIGYCSQDAIRGKFGVRVIATLD